MMNQAKLNYTLAVAAFLCCDVAFGQASESASHEVTIDFPEVACVAISSNANNVVHLQAEMPSDGGSAIRFGEAVDSSLWLNYSFFNENNIENQRQICVRLQNSDLSGRGLTLKVRAGDPESGDGEFGSATGNITLSSSYQSLVDALGSCYTGTGTGNGRRLVYSLEAKAGSYADLSEMNEQSYTVEYTIMD